MHQEDNNDDKTQTHIVLSEGTMVAHYRVMEKIGAGGMGEVYLAEDTELNRKVALKFLPSHLARDVSAKARFKREAQAAAKLSHPNIVTIYEVSEFNGRPFIVMEHVEGQSLRNHLKEKKLDIDDIVGIAIQICEGLQEAHSANVVHRDIKPSNIVVDKKGRPRLVDFGLATIIGTEHLTKTGSTLGTVGYMSPEQVRGKDVDNRSDLFSLGIILYELITQRRPFSGETEAEVLSAIQNNTPEPLARYKSDVPEELKRVISKLLEKDPSLRYQSAAGVVSDLKREAISTISQVASIQSQRKRNTALIGGIAALVVIVGLLVIFNPFAPTSKVDTSARKMLVVLPFENLGVSKDEYFADGITDEITSRLASVSGLGVISRTSAIQYKNTEKSLPEIAKELGVDYVLEGTIRWDKSGDTSLVRITPQLINVADNTHLWADNYERALTQIFAVQEEIANRISDALDLTLNEAERKAIETVPTKNLQAYDYYLKGLEYFKRREPFAQQMFEKAVELDSTFAPAFARLSHLHAVMYWILGDRTAERIRQIKSNADRALELSPDSYEPHGALGYYYYYVGRHYDKALEEFNKGLALKPNDPHLLSSVAFIKRRQGKWEEAYSLQKQGLVLDPLSASLSAEFITTCQYMRIYDEGIEEAKRAISLHPDIPDLYVNWALIVTSSTGDYEKALGLLEGAQNKTDMSGGKWAMAILAFLARDFDKALQLTQETLPEADNLNDTCDYYNSIGDIYYVIGDYSNSKAYFDSALSCYESAIGTIVSADDSALTKMSIAEVYAGLGRKEEAIKFGEEAYNQIPIERDALVGGDLMDQLARIFIRVGENDRALDLIEVVLSKPGFLSVPILKASAYTDPVREHPRFKALIEKYDKEA